jgi:hypothetical protein
MLLNNHLTMYLLNFFPGKKQPVYSKLQCTDSMNNSLRPPIQNWSRIILFSATYFFIFILGIISDQLIRVGLESGDTSINDGPQTSFSPECE